MNLGAIFLVLAVTLLVGIYISQPFLVRQRRGTVSVEEHELSSLMAERDRILTALQELDFDHTLGKIPSEDYPTMRTNLLQRGADILRKLDERTPQSSQKGDAESRIEAVIASRRADSAVQQGQELDSDTITDDDLEALIASRRRETKERTNGFCPNCGKPIMKLDKFCPHCGKTTK